MADLRAQKFQQGFLMGQSIVDALERKKMRDELKAANQLSAEQQTLGVNAPTAGAVPTGYEDYIQAGEGGKFVPRQTEGLDEAGLQQRQVIAERFNAPGAFAGERTSYSLGGLSQATPFTPEQVAQARMERKADIYSNYGKEDVAEQLRTNALARKSAALQIEKLQGEVDDTKAFKKDLADATKMLGTATTVAAQAKDLLDKGDREGAARVIADWRSTNVSDNKLMRVNENGLLEGSQDGGKTWVQASADKGNVYNPGVVENMLSDVKASADEHLNRMMFKHAKTPETFSQMLNATKELALRGETLTENKRQFDQTFGLKEKELKLTAEQGNRKLELAEQELKQKGLLIPSEIYKNMGIGRHYGTANELQDFQLKQLKEFTAEKDGIIKDLDSGKITKAVAQERLNMAGLKFGGKLAEPKQVTSTDLKNIEEVAMGRYSDWSKMPEPKRQEVRDQIKAEMGFGSNAAGTVDYMGIVKTDKGDQPKATTQAPQAQSNTGLRVRSPVSWTAGQGALFQNPQSVITAVRTARETGAVLPPELLDVAAYMEQQNPGIFDKGITGNRNTSWLLNTLNQQ